MISERAEELYDEGRNCSQCLILAAAEEKSKNIEEALNMLEGVYGGLGIGSICCGVLAGIMAIGILCDKTQIKTKRMEFLTRVYEKYGGADCPTLRAAAAKNGGCRRLVKELGEMVDEVAGIKNGKSSQ